LFRQTATWDGETSDDEGVDMSEKPSYLGLLNGIAVAETQAHCYLNAWIAVTPDPDVKAVLSKVTLREGEHGMSFAKRINELGYAVRERENSRAEEQLKVAGSDLSDLEKFRKLRLGSLDGEVLTYFDNVFSDHTIDIRTGELLGRYIAEEFDTARLLRACYQQLEARAAGGGRPADDRIDAVASRVDELCAAVEELRGLVGDAMGAPRQAQANGKAHASAARRTRRT
jgi:hypothetical protein